MDQNYKDYNSELRESVAFCVMKYGENCKFTSYKTLYFVELLIDHSAYDAVNLIIGDKNNDISYLHLKFTTNCIEDISTIFFDEVFRRFKYLHLTSAEAKIMCQEFIERIIRIKDLQYYK